MPENNNLNQLESMPKSNNLEDLALKEAEEKINKIKHSSADASIDFQETLKQKILERRQRIFRMPNFSRLFASLFQTRILIPAVSLVVLVAIIALTAQLWPSGAPGSIAGISRLVINPAYAQDNFEIIAEKSDSLGIENDTSFIIKSKTSVDIDELKENLSLEPAAEFDLEKISEQEFKITPKNDLKNKTVYKLKITAAYVAKNGLLMVRDFSFAFQVKEQFKVLNTLPGKYSTHVPLNSGIEVTFSHDNFKNYEKFISIEPAISGRFEKHKRTIVFVPKALAPKQVYTVAVSKDLPLEGSDMKLKEDYSFQFETDDGATQQQQEYFNFSEGWQGEFSTADAPSFAVYVSNEKAKTKFPAAIYSFKSQEEFIDAHKAYSALPGWTSFGKQQKKVDIGKMNKVANYDLQPQKYGYANYFVLPALLAKGYYLFEIKNNDTSYQAFFSVTDIAIYSAMMTNKSFIWINDIKAGTALANVKVEALGEEWNGTTDKNGYVEFDSSDVFDEYKYDEENYNAPQKEWYYFKVSSGEQSSVFPIYSHYYLKNKEKQYWQYFYTDRPMYQTTDTINFWGFLKERNGQKASGEVLVSLVNHYYDYFDYADAATIIAEGKSNVLENGSFSGKFDFINAAPGYYTLEIKLNNRVISSKYVEIQTYTKPAYNLELKPEKKAIFAGEDIKLNIKANFFEGTPIAKMALAIYGSSVTTKVITDEKGEAQIVESMKRYSDCAKAPCILGNPRYEYFSIRPEKSEEGEITANENVMVFSAKIGVEAEVESTSKTQATVKVKVFNVDLEKINSGKGSDFYGAVASDAPVYGEIIEIEHKKKETGEYYDFVNKVVSKTYNYYTVEKTILNFNDKIGADGKFKFDFEINADKSYKAIVFVTDNDGKHDYANAYLYRKYKDYDFSNEFYALKIKSAKEDEVKSFSVGEKVELEFTKNNVPINSNEKSRFLYYQLREGLINTEISNDSSFDFIFNDEYIPNLFVWAIWFDGKHYQENSNGWWGGGEGLNIAFKNEDRDLKIEIKADKEKYKPGEMATLNVKVADKEGTPKKAAVNLNLIDEAYYKLVEGYISPRTELYAGVIGSGLIGTYASHPVVKPTGGAEGGGCFLAGTKIRMADGNLKNIEDIKSGDEILTFENYRTQKIMAGKVERTFEHIVGGYLIINNRIKVTPEHRMFVNRGWQTIGTAKVGDYLTGEAGEAIRINSIEWRKERVQVYNFVVEKYHTYFANGVYAHNDKGGGARQNFVDMALFASVETDSKGAAKITFKLPDNLTSWRANAQAISHDLFAGNSTAAIPVSLPAFVEPVFAKEYLESDLPIIKVNSFGDALKSDDSVIYSLTSDSLAIAKTSKEGKAFAPEYFELGELKEGKHDIITGMESGVYEDLVKKTISVVSSRLKKNQKEVYELKEGLAINGGKTGLTKLTFVDKNQGQFYHNILSLFWAGGDRVDQALSRQLGGELLKKYFNEDFENSDEFNANLYLRDNGGIALLPYADPDLELTAKVATVAHRWFYEDKLNSYFSNIFVGTDANQEEIAWALLGLASLDKPVLQYLQNFSESADLKIREKLVIGIALTEIGDSEKAREIFAEILDKNIQKAGPFLRIKGGKDTDDFIADTVLAAVLAARVNAMERDDLWGYVENNWTKDILVNMEKLFYIESVMPNLLPGEVNFSVAVGDKKYDQKLSKGATFNLRVKPEELPNVNFSGINGNISLIASYEDDITNASELISNPDIKVSREYRVNGKTVTNFKEGDLVEIIVKYAFDEKALNDSYQITDFLPSGLKLITGLYDYSGIYGNNCNIYYPYSVEGQKLKFIAYSKNSYCGNDFSYYARVVNQGAFMAEPTIIQSFKYPEIANHGEYETIKIEK